MPQQKGEEWDKSIFMQKIVISFAGESATNKTEHKEYTCNNKLNVICYGAQLQQLIRGPMSDC